jgi:transcriptional regulator with GAF, ATPase, and Fis domain
MSMSAPVPAPVYEFLGLRAVFTSPVMLATFERVRRFARSDATVLIEGESGVGKEVVARALHHHSARANRAWVDVSCAALPDNLVESELFGYERGAFSGADTRKPGLFDMADGGTLFLDEIGELEVRLQVKLLRVLDYGEFFRLGGTRKMKVDVRILAATNQDLEQAVEQGRFRKDLYHRLAQLRVLVPPLRDRPEDVLALAELFRGKHGLDKTFAPAVREALLQHSWPGNVRELRNAVMAAAATSAGERIELCDLPASVTAGSSGMLPGLRRLAQSVEAAGSGGDDEPAEGGLLENAERSLIFQVLRQTNGHQEKAARILGISSRTLSRKLRAYRPGLDEAGPPPESFPL